MLIDTLEIHNRFENFYITVQTTFLLSFFYSAYKKNQCI